MVQVEPQSIAKRIREIYQRGYVIGDDDAQHSIAPHSVASWRGEFVRNLCLAEHATSSLEVGMAWGLSTLHIIEALLTNGATGRAHVVIDPMQSSRYHNAALRSLHDAGVGEMVEFHEAVSDLVLPKLVSEGRQFDFAFIDGDHRFEGVFLDVVFVNRLLRPGGVVAIDDTWSHPVYLACKFLEVYLHYTQIAQQLKPPGDKFTGEVQHRRRHDPSLGDALPKVRAYRKPLTQEEHDDELDFSRFAMADINLPGAIADGHLRRLSSYGLRAISQGDLDEARQALGSVLRLNPGRLKNYARFVRTMLPARMARQLSGRTGRTKRNLSD